MFGKHLEDQYSRQEDRQRDREGETQQEPRGEGRPGGTACAFQESCYTSQLGRVGTSSSAAFHTERLGCARRDVRLARG